MCQPQHEVSIFSNFTKTLLHTNSIKQDETSTLCQTYYTREVPFNDWGLPLLLIVSAVPSSWDQKSFRQLTIFNMKLITKIIVTIKIRSRKWKWCWWEKHFWHDRKWKIWLHRIINTTACITCGVVFQHWTVNTIQKKDTKYHHIFVNYVMCSEK